MCCMKERVNKSLEMMMIMIDDLYSALRRAPILRYLSRCVLKRNVFSADRKDPMLSDDQATGSRPSDLPRRMPDVRTYCNDDVVRSVDGEWQIGDADDWQCLDSGACHIILTVNFCPFYDIIMSYLCLMLCVSVHCTLCIFVLLAIVILHLSMVERSPLGRNSLYCN